MDRPVEDRRPHTNMIEIKKNSRLFSKKWL